METCKATYDAVLRAVCAYRAAEKYTDDGENLIASIRLAWLYLASAEEGIEEIATAAAVSPHAPAQRVRHRFGGGTTRKKRLGLW